MMTDEQIREEAAKKLETMDPEDRQALEDEIRAYLDSFDRIKQWDELTSREKDTIHYLETVHERHSSAGGLDIGVTQAALMRSLNATRDELASMEKNPYTPTLLRTLAIAGAVGIGGNVATAFAAKALEIRLVLLHFLLFSCAFGFLLSAAGTLMDLLRFRRMQKLFRDPAFQQKEIDAAVYNITYERMYREWEERHPDNGDS